MRKYKYGKYIYEYLQDIHRDFEKLKIDTLDDLKKELLKRVKIQLYKKYPEDAKNIIVEFEKKVLNQQCSKVIINDFKRTNFNVKNPISQFNLFYYSDYLNGFEKNRIRDQGNLRIKKYIENINIIPCTLVVFWMNKNEINCKKIIDFY